MEESLAGVNQKLAMTNERVERVEQEGSLTNEFLDLTVDVFRDKFDSLINFIQGDSLEQLEQRRETAKQQATLMGILESVNENLEKGVDQRGKIIENQEKEETEGGLSGLGLAFGSLAVAIGVFKGVLQGYVASTKALLVSFKNLGGALFKATNRVFSFFTSALRSRFESINKLFTSFQKIATTIVTTFRNFAARVKNIMSVGAALGRATLMAPINAFFAAVRRFQGIFTKAGQSVSRVGSAISKTFAAITKPFSDVIGIFRNAFSGITNIVKGAASTTGRIGKIFATISGFVGRIASAAAMVARFAGPIGVAINLAVAAFGTIKGALQGFKEGGVLGALKGAISGFLKALIGVPLDFIKGAVSWILNLFGLDKVAGLLESFSFKDLIESIVEAPFKIIEFIKDWIAEKVRSLGRIVGALIPDSIKKLLGIDEDEDEPRTREDVETELKDARTRKASRFGFGAEERRQEDQEEIDALKRELAIIDNAEGPSRAELRRRERERKKKEIARARQSAGLESPSQPTGAQQSGAELDMAQKEQGALESKNRGGGGPGGVGVSNVNNSTTNMISQPTINNNPLPSPSRSPDTAKDLYYRNPSAANF